MVGTMRVAATLARGFLGAYGGDVTDVVIARLSSTGKKLLDIAYLGGDAYDEAHAVGLDATGRIYVVGSTNSDDFPVHAALQSTWIAGTCGHGFEGEPGPCDEAFALALSPSLDTLVYSTYLGAPGETTGDALAVDAAGNLYETGGMQANGLGPGAPLPPSPTEEDLPEHCYVVQLNSAGQDVGQAPVSALSPCTGINLGPRGSLYVSGTLVALRPPARHFASSDLSQNAPENGSFLAKVAIGTQGWQFNDVIDGMFYPRVTIAPDDSLSISGTIWDTRSYPSTASLPNTIHPLPIAQLAASGDALLNARAVDLMCVAPTGEPYVAATTAGLVSDRRGDLWVTGYVDVQNGEQAFLLAVDAATGTIGACQDIGPLPGDAQGTAVALAGTLEISPRGTTTVAITRATCPAFGTGSVC